MLISFFSLLLVFVIAIPLFVISGELLIALWYKKSVLFAKNEDKVASGQSSYKIVMPAHNEADIIKSSLSGLLQKGVPSDSIIVVADNCTDLTASIVKELGVTVIERFSDEKRGKGYALDFGLSYLKDGQQEHADVVIILDADCEIDGQGLSTLATECVKHSRPVQALYLMRTIANSSIKQRVAGFAWFVKNKIRPFAVNKLNLPVTLTGTGMAFPWAVIQNIDIAHGNIVEDMQLGIDCTLNGFPPMFCQKVVVYSDFPTQIAAEKTQRTRWEHGHLTTITQQVPSLLKQAWVKKEWPLLGMALDLAVPPLALLVMISLMGLVLLAGLSVITGSYMALLILSVIFSLFSTTLVSTWYFFGRDYLTLKELLSIPLYIVSKISVYSSFILKKQLEWVRTDRDKATNDK